MIELMRRFKFLMIAALIAIVSFCLPLCGCSNGAENTQKHINEASTISQLLGAEKQVFLDTLKLDIDTDMQPYTYPQDIGDSDSGKQTYRLTEPFTYEGKDAIVEIDFQNDICCRIGFLFNSANDKNQVNDGYWEAAYNYAKDLREEFGEIYGETDSYPGMSSNFDNISSYEQIVQAPGSYHEEWEVKQGWI